MTTVAQAIAAQLNRIVHVERDPKHPNYAFNLRDAREAIAKLEREYLPHGSGYDRGCTVSGDGRTIVVSAPFHHMDDNGYYDGWGVYVVTVRPSFFSDGLETTVKGGRRAERLHMGDQIAFALASRSASRGPNYRPATCRVQFQTITLNIPSHETLQRLQPLRCPDGSGVLLARNLHGQTAPVPGGIG